MHMRGDLLPCGIVYSLNIAIILMDNLFIAIAQSMFNDLVERQHLGLATFCPATLYRAIFVRLPFGEDS
uniref:Uncharacterized protein n=1 Tax=Romanomermis culicivorax TaxID=13658 RepID=A0A915K5M8_ROMCU